MIWQDFNYDRCDTKQMLTEESCSHIETQTGNITYDKVSILVIIQELDPEFDKCTKKLKELEAKGPFPCLGLQVRFKSAYQTPINYSFLLLVKHYSNGSTN